LLDCIAGIVAPDEGRIGVGDRVFSDTAAGKWVPASRRQVGYVFQDLALFPHLTVAENIAYGLAGWNAAERQGRVQAILARWRISMLADRYPREISGGERQRVALARALVGEPCVLLLDEPLAALDAPVKSALLEDLRIWNQARRIPIVYVTHSREEVFALGERVLLLEGGRITSQGTPFEVLEAPRRERIAQLAGFENIFEARVVETHETAGTMTCRLEQSNVQIEAPLVRIAAGGRVRLALRAGDVLLATVAPEKISARNVISGTIASLQQRDYMVVAVVDCGVRFEVHLTPGARDHLQLVAGMPVWLAIKTHSLHVVSE
jgi:molybdate transport system ATP-binding protein